MPGSSSSRLKPAPSGHIIKTPAINPTSLIPNPPNPAPPHHNLDHLATPTPTNIALKIQPFLLILHADPLTRIILNNNKCIFKVHSN